MGYDLAKRISDLKKQAEFDAEGRIGLFRASLLSCLVLGILCHFLSRTPQANSEADTHQKARRARAVQHDEKNRRERGASMAGLLERLGGKQSQQDTVDPEDAAPDAEAGETSELDDEPVQVWKRQTAAAINERTQWLRNIPLLGALNTRLYRGLAELTLGSFAFAPSRGAANQLDEMLSLQGLYLSWSRGLISSLLRVEFAFVTCWPFWLAAFAVGYRAIAKRLRPVRTKDILGVCDRGNGPFYSGIFGPLRSNQSFSGTDYSCPSLACPLLASESTAQAHALVKMLKSYRAFNATNLDLVRVILAYRDFPSFVEEERPAEDDSESEGRNAAPASSLISNKGGTIEQSALEGLKAVLEAHRALSYFHHRHSSADLDESLGADYGQYLTDLEAVAAKFTPLGRLLLFSLTHYRSQALVKLSSAAVASAYLAIEAGKALVYRREDGGFTRISRFPHLQARAVIQSLVSYHEEYNGDLRQIIRQAIICSRRHGDFGRAFLPNTMPPESRALRDWLELLYAPERKRADAAPLVELDAHLEEISMQWRRELGLRLRESREKQSGTLFVPEALETWKGVVYKSVVLMPLQQVVEIALSGLDERRKERISQLLGSTRDHQASISIAARLPGFKRQAAEAQKVTVESGSVTQMLTERQNGAELVERWIIIRRMLTRYNWLSTRVGDDAVPLDGLIQAVIVDRTQSEKPAVIGLDALVPLRHRRFRELFGSRWETLYYAQVPHPNDIEVILDTAKYDSTLQQREKEAAQGLLSRDDNSFASAG